MKEFARKNHLNKIWNFIKGDVPDIVMILMFVGGLLIGASTRPYTKWECYVDYPPYQFHSEDKEIKAICHNNLNTTHCVGKTCVFRGSSYAAFFELNRFESEAYNVSNKYINFTLNES